jgi:hypothetical protein
MGMGELAASSLAALIVGGAVGLIAWSLISRGLKQLRAQDLAFDRTAHSLARDADIIKEKVHV